MSVHSSSDEAFALCHFVSAVVRSALPQTAPAARRQVPRVAQAGGSGTKTEYSAALMRRGKLGARSERGRSFAVVERLGVESTTFPAQKIRSFPCPNRGKKILHP